MKETYNVKVVKLQRKLEEHMFNTAKRGAVFIANSYELLISKADLLAREGRLIRIP